MAGCTSLQKAPGTIGWNQANVTVQEGQGTVEVSAGRFNGTDGYAVVFVRAHASGANTCASLVDLRVPRHCSPASGGGLDLVLGPANCSACIGCHSSDESGCALWWEFGSGDDFNKTLAFDIPDDLLHEADDRAISLELYGLSLIHI